MKNRKIVSIIGLFFVFLLISFPLASADNPVVIEAEKNLYKGYQEFRSKKFNDAIEYLEKSYQLIPYSKTAYYLSRCYFQIKDFPKTRSYAEKALSDSPELDDTYKNNIEKLLFMASERKPYGSSWEAELDSKADQSANIVYTEPDESEFKLSEYYTAFYKIRNRWKEDNYLHIEHGKIECGKINQGWWSAQWMIEQIEGTNLSRIRNRWKNDQYLHIEHGKIECDKIHSGVWSTQWVINPPLK